MAPWLRDRHLQPEAIADAVDQLVQLSLLLALEAIAGLQQFQPSRLGVLLQERIGGVPLPLLGLLGLQVRDDLALEGNGLVGALEDLPRRRLRSRLDCAFRSVVVHIRPQIG